MADLVIDDPDDSGATFDEGPLQATATTLLTVDIMARSLNPTGSNGLGIGDGAIAAWDDMPVRARFLNNGEIQVNINGSTYGCDGVCPTWNAGTWYHFRFAINVVANTYDVLVSEYGTEPTNVIADDRAFQPAATSLDRWGGWAEGAGVAEIHHSVAGTWNTSCTPDTTCNGGAWTCDSPPDGCGDTQSCGACGGIDVCDASFTCCTPLLASNECSAVECGIFDNTCDGTYDCDAELGTCDSRTSGDVCFSGACCTPLGAAWCTSQGNECGGYDDTCGDTVNCGSCAVGESCQSGTCSETGGGYAAPQDGDYDHVIVLSANTTGSSVVSQINALGAGTVLVRSDATRRTVTGGWSSPRAGVTVYNVDGSGVWYIKDNMIFYDIDIDVGCFRVEGADNWRILYSRFDYGRGGAGACYQSFVIGWTATAGVATPSTVENYEVAFTEMREYHHTTDEHTEAMWMASQDGGWIHNNIFDDGGTTGHLFFTYQGTNKWVQDVCVEDNVFIDVLGSHGYDIQYRNEYNGSGVQNYIDPNQPSSPTSPNGLVVSTAPWSQACPPGSGGSFRP